MFCGATVKVNELDKGDHISKKMHRMFMGSFEIGDRYKMFGRCFDVVYQLFHNIDYFKILIETHENFIRDFTKIILVSQFSKQQLTVDYDY